jgi:uncharacterized protein YwqG
MHELDDPALRQKLAPHRRSTWIPQVEEGAGAPDASRFGGTPWLRPGESWPACFGCGRPMQFFLQLNARDLPQPAAQALEGGMVQFFYCIREDPACEQDWEGWAPLSKASVIRLIPRDDLGGDAVGAPDAEAFPPRHVTGWTEAADYPNVEETETLGIALSDEETDALYDAEFPHSGEKLLGWPHWVQGIEYPECPACGSRMELLVQVDSDHNIPHMWGDAGVGHITQCPRHRNRLAFGWACY